MKLPLIIQVYHHRSTTWHVCTLKILNPSPTLKIVHCPQCMQYSTKDNRTCKSTGGERKLLLPRLIGCGTIVLNHQTGLVSSIVTRGGLLSLILRGKGKALSFKTNKIIVKEKQKIKSTKVLNQKTQ